MARVVIYGLSIRTDRTDRQQGYTICKECFTVRLQVRCKRTGATTPNTVGPTMLGVAASASAVVWKRKQQLPTILGRAVLRRTDTTHKTLKTMCNLRAWPQKSWKSCANGSNIAPRDHGKREGGGGGEEEGLHLTSNNVASVCKGLYDD